jgi:hypothetical protein
VLAITGEVVYMDCLCAGDATIVGDALREESSTEVAKKKLLADKVLQTNSRGDATNPRDEFLQRRVAELEL